MINSNGNNSTALNSLSQNRGFLYGDAVFETMKIVNSKILFLEDHYFRLMASMRILRMEIPMDFTMEFFEEQVLTTVTNNGFAQSSRARITVYRNDGGFYLPTTNTISFLIHASPLDNKDYLLESRPCEVDLYKDFYISKQLLSTLKTTNKVLHVTASIYADENDLDNCILLNESKNVVEVLQGNIFMLQGNRLITPPVSEGCCNGILRKQLLVLAKKIEGLEVIEEVISPFDLQKADELFYTNVIKGIQSITKYRKKDFTNVLANQLVEKLNKHIAI
ncbi:MAG: putative branched-chain-amino-acid aminotransferase [Bacteroidota bacterium]|jgi:branched-chain amino acid aminotransferase